MEPGLPAVVSVLGPVALDPGPHGVGPATLLRDRLLGDGRMAWGVAADEIEEEVTMERLWDLRLNPAAVPSNLLLSSVPDAVAETRRLVGTTGSAVVVDCTPHDEGRNPRGLVLVAREVPGLTVVMGAQPPREAPTDAEAVAAALVRELMVGVGLVPPVPVPGGALHCARAGVIGEIAVGKAGAASETLLSEEVVVLRGAGMAQRQTGAPLILSVPRDASPLLVLDAITTARNGGAALNRTVLAGVDIQDLDAGLRALLADGLRLCVGGFGESYVLHQSLGLGRLPLRDDELAREMATLVAEGAAAPSQLIPSMHLRMKTQLVRYGGHGYGHVHGSLVCRTLKQQQLSDGQVSAMCHTGDELLRWWNPPPMPEPVARKSVCSWCGKQFVYDDNEHFSKFDFEYCKSSCLRKHRKANFEPRREQGGGGGGGGS